MSDEQNILHDECKSRLGAGKDWKDIVAWVGDLPPLPHVAAQALTLVEDPDTTANQLTTLLSEDTALAARVLKIANSAMFSRQREITTISQAIMTIGFKTLKGVIVAATLRQLNREFGKIERMLWENSVCTAIAARTLCEQLRRPYADEVVTLGLLHDLGKLVLRLQLGRDYEEIVNLTKQGISAAEVEQEQLGYSHQLIGALVAKKWNFSLETCQVILHHHDPLADGELEGESEKTALVQTADLIAHTLGFSHPEGYPDLKVQALENMSRLGIPAAAHEELLKRANDAYISGSTAMLS